MSDLELFTEDLIPCCSICGSQTQENLGMLPVMNDFGNVMAFIFICSEHQEKIKGKVTKLEFGDPMRNESILLN